MTMLVVAGGIATGGCLAGLLGWAVWRMMHPRAETNIGGLDETEANGNEVTAGAFSPDRYLPMERLLLAEEFQFLESQPGYRPEIGAEWKRGRKRIFRMYLDELKRDFQRLHARARAMVAESGAESSELVGVLIRQQLTFLGAITMVEVRLAFAGTEFPQINIRPLIELLEANRLDLERFALQAA